MSTRIYFLIYSRWSNWNLLIKFIARHHTPRYLLCCSTLPLCSKNRSRIRRICSHVPLIPTNVWCNAASTMNQGPILYNVHWCKCNLLPSALSRTKGHATTILRLPRCIYKMKCSIICWCNNVICGATNIHFYCMRSLSRTT